MIRFNFFEILAEEYAKAKVEQQVNKVHQISGSSNCLRVTQAVVSSWISNVETKVWQAFWGAALTVQ